MARRVWLYNIIGCAFGVAMVAALRGQSALSFASGYVIGMANGLWLLRIAGKGVSLPAEKASAYVMGRYYVRFVLTVVVLASVIYADILEPLPLVMGLVVSIIATLAVLIIGAVRQEVA
jgi:hypothetical protein